MKFKYFSKVWLLPIAAAFALISMDATAKSADDAVNTSDEEQVEQLAEDYNDSQKDERSKVVCKKEAQTGTRFKKTVCRTVATMDADQENAKRTLNRMRTFSPGDEGG